ncbi:MAG: fibronectin type III domain-containing protein, partial [Candidatus Cloacimonetes bacterium]|nr:fibronectin type III domain-containing protein [Candidatus Cloacimonadota bacterium]
MSIRLVIMSFLIWIFLGQAVIFSITVETASLQGFMYGEAEGCEYDDWISHQVRIYVRVNYNAYTPYYRNHPDHPFGTFYTPEEDELENWDEVVNLFIEGEYEIAQEAIDIYEFPYQVVEFHDTDTERVYYMLREKLNMELVDDHGDDRLPPVIGGFDYGWGIFIVNPASTKRYIVNVVHPCDDFIVPPLAVSAFQKWDARYLLYASASREAAIIGQPSDYTNNRSNSDPSRQQVHPFNNFYKAACQEIRSSFGLIEFSAQLHSFDWNSSLHVGAPYNQVSSSPGTAFPTLPVRDLSSNKLDLINQTDYLVFPANTIGIHPPVYLNDYYGVNYDKNQAPFIYDNGQVQVEVNNFITLPGAAANVQFLHTTEAVNPYDNISNFFHVEFAELPHCYPRSQNVYRWFHGYNLSDGCWNKSRRFENVLAFYTPTIENMKVVLETTFEGALGNLPLPVPPQNFRATVVENRHFTVEWDPVDLYNFYGYEIYFCAEGNQAQPVILSRNSGSATLANVMLSKLNITGLEPLTTYEAKIRVVDQAGNRSEYSPEIEFTTCFSNFMNTTNYTSPAGVVVSWSGSQPNQLHSFRVYKGLEGQELTLLADWMTHPDLLIRGIGSRSYTVIDTQVQNDQNYHYKLAKVFNTGYVEVQSTELFGYPRPVFTIFAESDRGVISDFCRISYGPQTTDGYDGSVYDTTKSGTLPAAFTEISIWKNSFPPVGNNIRLSQEYVAEYDLTQQYKTFFIRVRSNQSQVKIRSEHPLPAGYCMGVLHDVANNIAVDLFSQDYVYTSTNTAYKDFYLHIGKYQPIVNIASQQNMLYRAPQTMTINFNTNYPFLVDHVKVLLVSETDSLVVADYIPPTQTSVRYRVPFNVLMNDSRVVVEATSLDGNVRRFTGNWRIDILPQQNTVIVDAGKHFLANPYSTENIEFQELAPVFEVYEWDQNTQWSPA